MIPVTCLFYGASSTISVHPRLVATFALGWSEPNHLGMKCPCVWSRGIVQLASNPWLNLAVGVPCAVCGEFDWFHFVTTGQSTGWTLSRKTGVWQASPDWGGSPSQPLPARSSLGTLLLAAAREVVSSDSGMLVFSQIALPFILAGLFPPLIRRTQVCQVNGWNTSRLF